MTISVTAAVKKKQHTTSTNYVEKCTPRSTPFAVRGRKKRGRWEAVEKEQYKINSNSLFFFALSFSAPKKGNFRVRFEAI